jgi:NAD-dependent deacetylase
MEKALLSAMSADLFVVIGSSLKVNPAYLIPMASNGKLVICNAEPSPLDSQANLLIRGSIENILKTLQ